MITTGFATGFGIGTLLGLAALVGRALLGDAGEREARLTAAKVTALIFTAASLGLMALAAR